MSASILAFKGIEKSFFGVRVLRNVSFELEQGHALGLIGENGAGKSTLMNILGGVLQPDAGELTLAEERYMPRNPKDAVQRGVAFIHQELNLFTNLSIAENIFIDSFPRLPGLPFINKRAVKARVSKYLDAVDLHASPDALVESLSLGERQLVEVAKALSTDAKVIIFDEPTTSLTARETERLFKLIERLREQGTSIIYISHILNDVRRLCDDIVVLRDGEVVGSGTREKLSIDQMISLMVGRKLEQLYPPRTSVPLEESVLNVKGLSQAGIVKDISFALHKGEVLGIFGLMGSGRTELARILFGLDPFETGEIVVNGVRQVHFSPRTSIQNGLAFVTEDRRDEGLLMDLSIAENMALVALPKFTKSLLQIDRTRMYREAKEVAGSLHVKSDAIERQEVKSLSGGNQQKVVVAKWLMAKPSVFVLDEPTRGVDVGAKYEIYSIINDLAAQQVGMLVISSEIEELIGICDRILVMSNGEIYSSFSRSDFKREEILRAAFRESGVAS